MSDASLASTELPVAASWPAGGLESVRSCPVCDDEERELLHEGLRDRVFGCAPGEWNLFRCGKCGTGYLDPRPNLATIGLAYSRYCTHEPVGWLNGPEPSAWRRHRIAQRNAYFNAHYGYHLTPATARPPRWLSLARQQRFDKYTGYLRYPGKGARILDIGCGNGCFLLQMRSLGWEVSGVEPDPHSAAQAVGAGLDVRVGLLEQQSLPDGHCDAVSLNHVIEHLHDPLGTLRICHRILKPGGRIFIATPNFTAGGHRLFGANWFPLDPPRHLVLFTPDSLKLALREAGFAPDSAIRLRLAAKEMFMRSMHLVQGSDPMRQEPPLSFAAKLRAGWLAFRADRATCANRELTEELVLLASRPA